MINLKKITVAGNIRLKSTVHLDNIRVLIGEILKIETGNIICIYEDEDENGKEKEA